MRDALRIQSAMDYLMTYGWSIVVIVIAVAVLYYLGVFGGNAGLGSSCLAQTGYVCGSLVLNSLGVANVMLGQVSGYPITITAIACTNSSAAPTNTITVSGTTLQNEAQARLSFQCPGASGPIGKQYAGYLWIVYSTTTQSGLVAQVASFSAHVATASSTVEQSSNIVTLCASAENNAATSLSANVGCSLYFCGGGNYNYAMTYSWSHDAVSSPAYAATGSQSSNICTATSSGATYQGLGVVGVNGIAAYSIINSPTTYNAVGSTFNSMYYLSTTSNVLLLVACGWYPCSAVTFPSGCTSEVSEDVGTSAVGTVAMDYCQSQPSGVYSITGTATSTAVRIAVEAALLTGSGHAPATASLTFSNGNTVSESSSDIVTATTSVSGDQVAVEYCSGSGCTPSNILATGTTTATYNTNALSAGVYQFRACDTTEGICSTPTALSITSPISISFSAGTAVVPGTNDIVTGSTAISGDGVSINYCSGSSCTPGNVVASGTTTTTYNLNGLAIGTYGFNACDTTQSLCTSTYTVTISNNALPCTNTIYTYYNGIVANTVTVSYTLCGGGGGGGEYDDSTGGNPGSDSLEVAGNYILNAGNVLTIYVGGGGGGGGWDSAGGGGGGGSGYFGGGGGTGSGCGCYTGSGGGGGSTVILNNNVLVSNAYSFGGAGGGSASYASAGGGGGTDTGGGSAGSPSATGVTAGSQYIGGAGAYGGSGASGQGGSGETGGAGSPSGDAGGGGGGGYGGGGGGAGNWAGGAGGAGGTSGATGTAGSGTYASAAGLGSDVETSAQYGLGGAAGTATIAGAGGNAGIAILSWTGTGGCSLSNI